MRFTSANEKYLRVAIQIIVGLIFLTPLIVASHYYFPFIAPRNLYFRTLVEILVLVYLALIAHNRAYLPRKNILWIVFSLFAATLTLSSILGGDFSYSLWSNYERMEGLVTVYHLLAFFFVIFGTFQERTEWERLLQMSIFVAIVTAFIGLSQVLDINILLESSGGTRSSSTLGNPTYLSSYLLIHSFFALYFIMKAKERSDLWFYRYGFLGLAVLLIALQVRFSFSASAGTARGIGSQLFASPMLWVPFVALVGIAFTQFAKHRLELKHVRIVSLIFYWICAVLFLFLIVMTQTRGAVVGIGLAALAAAAMLLFRRGEKGMIRAGAALFILLAMGSGYWVFANRDSQFIKDQPLLQRIASISLTEATTQSRLATWKVAYRAFLDKPVLGWGVENFHKAFNLYFPTIIYQDEGNPLWFDRPHNLLLQYLVEGGAVSFGLYSAFLIAAVFLLLRRVRDQRIGVLLSALVVGYIGQNIFVFDSINSYVPFFLALGFIAFMVTQRGADALAIRPVPRTRIAATVIILGVSLTGVVWYQWRAMAMNYNFVTGYREQLSQPGTYNGEATEKIFEAIDAGPRLGKAELLGVYSEFATGVLQNRAAPDYEVAPMVSGIAERLEKIIQAHPGDARMDMFLMNLYLNANRISPEYLDRLLELSKDAIALSPTRPQLYYITGRAHILRGENDEALADFRTAVELVPNVFDAHWNLFAAYATIGKREEAAAEVKKLKELKRFDVEQYARTASIYASSKLFENAEKVIQDGLIEFPDDAQLIGLLAQIYAAQGKNKEARALIDTLVAANPQLKAQADEFYKKLDDGSFQKQQGGD